MKWVSKAMRLRPRRFELSRLCRSKGLVGFIFSRPQNVCFETTVCIQLAVDRTVTNDPLEAKISTQFLGAHDSKRRPQSMVQIILLKQAITHSLEVR
jgi:hypothetical protein